MKNSDGRIIEFIANGHSRILGSKYFGCEQFNKYKNNLLELSRGCVTKGEHLIVLNLGCGGAIENFLLEKYIKSLLGSNSRESRNLKIMTVGIDIDFQGLMATKKGKISYSYIPRGSKFFTQKRSLLKKCFRTRLDLLCADIEKSLPIKNNSVDIIFSAFLMLHLTSVGREILDKEIKRILKPNGFSVLL